jgi:hypothetical protein
MANNKHQDHWQKNYERWRKHNRQIDVKLRMLGRALDQVENPKANDPTP